MPRSSLIARSVARPAASRLMTSGGTGGGGPSISQRAPTRRRSSVRVASSSGAAAGGRSQRRVDPSAIDDRHPRFGLQVHSQRRGDTSADPGIGGLPGDVGERDDGDGAGPEADRRRLDSLTLTGILGVSNLTRYRATGDDGQCHTLPGATGQVPDRFGEGAWAKRKGQTSALRYSPRCGPVYTIVNPSPN